MKWLALVLVAWGASAYDGPWYGFAFGTPVTDGKHVWVRFFTGVIACYDLEGDEHCRGFRVYDAKTGRRVETPAIAGVGAFRNEAVWTPPAFAGGYVFFCSRGSSSWREAGTGSYISVMEARPDGRFVAHHRLDGQLDTPPVLEGKRIYLRTNTGLVCFGE